MENKFHHDPHPNDSLEEYDDDGKFSGESWMIIMLYVNNNIKEDISTLMKIDTGENEHICNNLKYFYGIKFREYNMLQVGRGIIKSKGFGLVFIQLKAC